MASSILRRSSSIFSRCFFAAVTSIEPLMSCRNNHALFSAAYDKGDRLFHAKSGPLNFHSSLVSRGAQLAVDYDDAQHNEGDEGLEIAELGISNEIVNALAKKGITKLFPIQKVVLEPAMKGRDMIGRARTGTGKTLAFEIPILDKIIKFNAKYGKRRDTWALVLAPTRELARQVEKEFNEVAPNLETVCLYGGM